MLARGVWGHAPPGNLRNLGALRSILMRFERKYFTAKNLSYKVLKTRKSQDWPEVSWKRKLDCATTVTRGKTVTSLVPRPSVTAYLITKRDTHKKIPLKMGGHVPPVPPPGSATVSEYYNDTIGALLGSM